jgi:hypothetical protein
VIPKLKVLPWTEEGWKATIEELHSRQKIPPAASGDLFKTTVQEMMKTYARKVSLSTMEVRKIWRGYRGRPMGSGSGAWQASPQFGFCLRMGGLASLQIAVERFLPTGLSTSQNITTHLVPLLKELVSLASKYSLLLSSEPFASAIRRILVAWTTHVLGPRPSKTTIVPAYQAGLGRYTCRCTECLRVQAFLRGAQSSERLERIGATKRKHVEQQIGACMGSLVTYSTITQSPQGLEVTLCPCST